MPPISSSHVNLGNCDKREIGEALAKSLPILTDRASFEPRLVKMAEERDLTSEKIVRGFALGGLLQILLHAIGSLPHFTQIPIFFLHILIFADAEGVMQAS